MHNTPAISCMARSYRQLSLATCDKPKCKVARTIGINNPGGGAGHRFPSACLDVGCQLCTGAAEHDVPTFEPVREDHAENTAAAQPAAASSPHVIGVGIENANSSSSTPGLPDRKDFLACPQPFRPRNGRATGHAVHRWFLYRVAGFTISPVAISRSAEACACTHQFCHARGGTTIFVRTPDRGWERNNHG